MEEQESTRFRTDRLCDLSGSNLPQTRRPHLSTQANVHVAERSDIRPHGQRVRNTDPSEHVDRLSPPTLITDLRTSVHHAPRQLQLLGDTEDSGRTRGL